MKKITAVFAPLFALTLAVSLPLIADADNSMHNRDNRERWNDSPDWELSQRVRELERTVALMQRRVHALESAPAPRPVYLQPWTCHVSAFGRTYVETRPSRGEAEALVVRECARDSNEIHCRRVVCGQ